MHNSFRDDNKTKWQFALWTIKNYLQREQKQKNRPKNNPLLKSADRQGKTNFQLKAQINEDRTKIGSDEGALLLFPFSTKIQLMFSFCPSWDNNMTCNEVWYFKLKAFKRRKNELFWWYLVIWAQNEWNHYGHQGILPISGPRIS